MRTFLCVDLAVGDIWAGQYVAGLRTSRTGAALLALWVTLLPVGAKAMFTNKSSKEINVKLIYVGPQDSGKVESLRYIYNRTDAESKGKMISVSGADQTIFFDFSPKALGEIRGFRIRIHLYTLAGVEQYEASTKLLLKDADGIVFVADCRPHRIEANIEALDRVRKAIQSHGRDWDKIPKVFQFNNAAANEETAAELKSILGVAPTVVVNSDTKTGEGVFDALKRGTKELLLGLKDGRVQESKLSPEEQRAGNQMIARVALMSHYGEFFGEGTHEFGPWRAGPDAPDFYIMLHPPTPKRPYFTYATFGLSIAQQPAGGPTPRVELIAYSEVEDERVAQSVLTVAKMIAGAQKTDPAFKMNDTVSVGEDHFVLVQPEEDSAFARFPNEARKIEDLRFTHFIGAKDEADARVTFLKLMPVSEQEIQMAIDKGTPRYSRNCGSSQSTAAGRSLR